MDAQNLPTVVGYARISSADQSEDGQVDALRRAGASRIVVENASGVAERPLLDELMAGLAAGDALVVTEVSRLGRTVHEILQLADDLRGRGVHLRILNLGIDTGTLAGELVLTMMAGLARFERDLLRERQRRRIEAARKRGKHFGRPPAQTRSHAETAIVRLQTESLAVIASEWWVSERTLSRLVRKHAEDGSSLPQKMLGEDSRRYGIGVSAQHRSKVRTTEEVSISRASQGCSS